MATARHLELGRALASRLERSADLLFLPGLTLTTLTTTFIACAMSCG